MLNVYDLNGNVVEQVEKPKIFDEELREDLVRRAFLSIRSKKRVPYGTDPMAGLRTAAHYHGHRPGRTGAKRWGMMGREMARLPRLHGKIAPHMMWVAREVPQARKG
ncbi:MAG: 50S ribosomal protein L4, partial [Candidatus Aenigmarchaeota archaeon]|nr:50S ribosomal protein L4 [Candidatus Aenigmarchaeota archaeon]MDW8149017.1 50S ribosomal protein L4 [Candidatus Aenigmarchaeota archaeon]